MLALSYCHILLHNHFNTTFVDINESEGYNDCHQICTNTEESYYCSCDTGFSLAADGGTCIGNSNFLRIVHLFILIILLHHGIKFCT